MTCLATMWQYLDQIHAKTSWNPSDLLSRHYALDTAWWMPAANSKDEKTLTKLAIQEWLCDSKQPEKYPKIYIFPGRDEIRLASASLLVTFLKHDRTSWLDHLALASNKETLHNLCQNFMETALKLSDSSITTPSQLHQSIACASLLSLMDAKREEVVLEQGIEFQQFVYSNKLLDNVFRSCFGIFGAASPSGPLWSFEHKDPRTLGWMEEFILCWSVSKDGKTRKLGLDAQEQYWKGPLEQSFQILVSEDHSSSGVQLSKGRPLLSRMMLMMYVSGSSLRAILISTLQQVAKNAPRNIDPSSLAAEANLMPCRRLLQSFQHLTCHEDLNIAICAASLMKTLLGGRSSVMTHDLLSRNIWNAINLEFVQQCIHRVLQISKSSTAFSAATTSSSCQSTRPLLLCLLDVLDLTLSSEPLLHEVIHIMDNESLEALIHLMSPKDIRIDQTRTLMNDSLDCTGLEDSDTDTPPANNLSRLDERSICIEKEEVEVAKTGIDQAIRISVATILSRFGYLDISNLRTQQQDVSALAVPLASANSLHLIQSRIRRAVTDFFSAASNATSTSIATAESKDPLQAKASTDLTFEHLHSTSMELTRRRFRLLVSMAVPENEEFLASCIFSKDKSHESLVGILIDNIRVYRQDLEGAAQREQQLMTENEEYRKKMDAQSVRFWREVQRVKKSNIEDTKSKVEIFDAERRVAEHRVRIMSKELYEAERRAREADESVKTIQQAELRTRAELEELSTQVVCLGEENDELKRQVGQRDGIIGDMKERMENMAEDQKRYEHTVAAKENQILNLEEGREGMEANLNNLFSDLVKLTNMYQIQEQQEKDLVDQKGRIAKDLQEERRQKEKAERLLQKENQELRDEKLVLEKKLAKYREKLEKYKEKLTKEKEQKEIMDQRQKNRNPIDYMNKMHDSINTSRVGGGNKFVRSNELQQRMGKENDYKQSSRRREGSQQSFHSRDEGYLKSIRSYR